MSEYRIEHLADGLKSYRESGDNRRVAFDRWSADDADFLLKEIARLREENARLTFRYKLVSKSELGLASDILKYERKLSLLQAVARAAENERLHLGGTSEDWMTFTTALKAAKDGGCTW